MTSSQPDDSSSVRVAVRVRPQLAKERIDMCQVCTSVSPDEPQVFLGKDKAFTYDYVFDMPSSQDQIYDNTGRALIEGCFEGYNATIFAYGQTGSGKTYTMGTGFDLNLSPEETGIVPRAVEHLFNGIEERRCAAMEKNEPPPDFKVNAQFMELYNEEILDLLDTTRDPQEKGRKSHIKIHEDASGGIYTVGVTTRQVSSYHETMQCLKVGALSRTTASTNMNAQSSRSHAIFTLHIKQQRIVKSEEPSDGESSQEPTVTTEFETLTAKFHFVDLAGSERLKRTGATGDRQKEGISINCGLLALGNVISALGDETKRGSHVPYRDSKLTRLLQDSLGGNSRTHMIACVSPSDRDFMETLNTLKYANRARNIQNKVTVNQDKTSKQIGALRAEIQMLQVELMEYRTGKRQVDEEGMESINDMFHENTMLQTENNNLRQRIKAMQETVERLTVRNTELLAERAMLNLSNMDENTANDEITKLIQGYVQEIEELRSKLIESESMVETMKRTSQRTPAARMSSMCMSPMTQSLPVPMTGSSYDFDLPTDDSNLSDVIALAKNEIKKEKKKIRKRNTSQSSDKENVSEEEKQDHEGTEHEGKDKDENDEDEDGEVDEDEDDDEEMEIGSSDSESEDEMYGYRRVETDELCENLASLTCDISIKEKLVEELEASQKRLHAMKQQYEDKLISLQSRIKETEVERDKVLANMGSVESATEDKTKKVKDSYEKKLSDMQNEVKKLQAAKKEHAKLVRNQAQYEKQLKTLQKDLADMKRTKVKLMQQIKEDSQKNRQAELRRNKEVAQLKKEQRAKEKKISVLESEKTKRDLVLRRKQEEVEALRKRAKPISSKVAGRVGVYSRQNSAPQLEKTVVNSVPKVSAATMKRRKREQGFSAKAAKQKWDTLEKTVSSVIVKKQTMSHMEKDMDRWLKQREVLGKKLEKFSKKRTKIAEETQDEAMLKDLNDQISTLKDNISYVQDNINECQVSIVQMEENKEDGPDPYSIFDSVSLDEAKYLLEHFVQLAISKGVLAAQKDSDSKELEAKLHQERMDSTFQRDMLQYLIQDQVDIQIDENLLKDRDEDSDTGSGCSSRSPSPVDSLESPMVNMMNPITAALLLPTAGLQPTGASGESKDSLLSSHSSLAGKGHKDKARRKTASPMDLLLGEGGAGEPAPGPSVMPPVLESPETERKTGATMTSSMTSSVTSSMTNSMTSSMNGSASSASGARAVSRANSTNARPNSMPVKKSEPSSGLRSKTAELSVPRSKADPSPQMRRKAPSSANHHPPAAAAPSPTPSPRNSTARAPPSGGQNHLQVTTPTTNGAGSNSSLSRQSSVDDMSPPASPLNTRRNQQHRHEGNVFSRLTKQANPSSPSPNRGIIQPVQNPGSKPGPLIHCHTAEGHSKAVLSVKATEDLLFSSSKDRTAKIWDLESGEEILTLDGHPNNVVKVEYCEETKLVFTVSNFAVKVYDMRQGPKCIQTLTSSGQTYDGAMPGDSRQRQLTNQMAAGENAIQDISINSTGTVLYSASSNTVRIWELRMYKAVGKLSGGHQAAVMVIAVDDTDTADGNICVVTGSKDHYIKVFDVGEDSVGVLTPKYNLEPPHYDGIQSLCLMGDLLFSGSRDMCVKKWNLADQKLEQSINGAHKDWITGLSFMPGGNALLSGCRGGILKLWNIDDCGLLGELRAHNTQINAIATNEQLIFTASNDKNIKIWMPGPELGADLCTDD